MDIFSKVPGFRSENQTKKIVATIYYLFFIGNMTVIAMSSPESVLITIPPIILPFTVFGLVDIKENIKNKKLIVNTILPIILLSIITFLAYYQH